MPWVSPPRQANEASSPLTTEAAITANWLLLHKTRRKALEALPNPPPPVGSVWPTPLPEQALLAWPQLHRASMSATSAEFSTALRDGAALLRCRSPSTCRDAPPPTTSKEYAQAKRELRMQRPACLGRSFVVRPVWCGWLVHVDAYRRSVAAPRTSTQAQLTLSHRAKPSCRPSPFSPSL